MGEGVHPRSHYTNSSKTGLIPDISMVHQRLYEEDHHLQEQQGYYNKNYRIDNNNANQGGAGSSSNDNDSIQQRLTINKNFIQQEEQNSANVRWSKLLRHDGQPSKVLLYPEEGWARTATNSYWLLYIPWWNRNRCKVVQVTGTRRSTTQAKLIEAGRGTVHVIGSFGSNSKEEEPDFKLSLTSCISAADYNRGYAMTGHLERGYDRTCLQMTHFAVLRKFD